MRSFTYPADVGRDEAGFYLVTFRDLTGCATDGRAPSHPRSAVISLAGGCRRRADLSDETTGIRLPGTNEGHPATQKIAVACDVIGPTIRLVGSSAGDWDVNIGTPRAAPPCWLAGWGDTVHRFRTRHLHRRLETRAPMER